MKRLGRLPRGHQIPLLFLLLLPALVCGSVLLFSPHQGQAHAAGARPDVPTTMALDKALVPPPILNAPQVLAHAPVQGATAVPWDQTVTALFDQDMDVDSFTPTSFFLKKGGVGSPLAATISYMALIRVVLLQPSANLEPNTAYEATLTTAVRSATGRTLAAPVTWRFTTGSTPPGPPSFSDVPPEHPYYNAITDLATWGIVLGYDDDTGRFGPEDPVKRMQFAKMIVKSLGLPVSGNEECPFKDVPLQMGTDPFYPSKYVAVCADQGITFGVKPTQFAPYNHITRYQVISMVVRALDKLRPGTLTPAPVGFGIWKNDATHGANGARAEYNGLLVKLDLATLNPYQPMTRGEVVQVLRNSMKGPPVS